MFSVEFYSYMYEDLVVQSPSAVFVTLVFDLRDVENCLVREGCVGSFVPAM